MSQTHFFYALKLPTSIKNQIHDQVVSKLRILPFSRWVHQEDYHITLAFLGGCELDMLRASQKQVRVAIASETTFPLTIQHLGTFGNPRSPRIFWAGLSHEERLQKLRQTVFTSCLATGFTLEKRPFHPHITIARKWLGNEAFKEEVLSLKALIEQPISLMATEVVLYQTHLDRTPKYEVVDCFPLLDTIMQAER